MNRVLSCLVLLFFVTAACVSCSRRPKLERPDGLPKLHPCSVTVTFGGHAMEGILVTLIPEDGSKWQPNATTDNEGTATPNASFGFKGAPAGKYTVAFTYVTDNPDYDERNPKSRRFLSLIPLKYGRDQSTEKLEIKAGEKNRFSYELEAGEEFVLPPKK
ncbi:MAG: hypothetical protein LBQ54_15885 [Planctomycetaceae bacterium]|nr:hypothetical protein [Planctomycetaceae bacterium]